MQPSCGRSSGRTGEGRWSGIEDEGRRNSGISPATFARHGSWFSKAALRLASRPPPAGVIDQHQRLPGGAGSHEGPRETPARIGACMRPIPRPATMGVTMRLPRIPVRVLPAALATAALSSGAFAADVSKSRAEADAMLRKVAVIATHGLASQPQARRTTVTESELNSFLEYHLRNEIPPAIIEPVVTIEEGGRLRGRALVDLDEVKKANAGDPRMTMLALASGRVPVEAAGTLRVTDGVAQFTLEETRVNGVPVPTAVLRQVVSYYSRSPENPAGIDLEAPFALPVKIRQIETLRGQAVIVQ